MKEFRCYNCKKKLFEADAIGTINIPCKRCKCLNKFIIKKEPDCLVATEFIETNQINEKTLSDNPDSVSI